MLDFDNFFRNHFDTKNISDDRLNKYTVEHVERLAAVARFASLATATLSAHGAYFGAISDEATNAAIQKAFTKAMTDKLTEFITLLGQHEGAIRSKWGEGSTEYIRFFPGGLTEYRRATLANIDEKLTRIEKAFTDLGSGLDPAVVNLFIYPGDPNDPSKPKGMIVRFRGARQAQLAAKAQTNEAKTKSGGTRDALEVQLMLNLLAVAQDAAPRPEAERAQLRKLFPQDLLQVPMTNAATDTPPAPGGAATNPADPKG